MLLNMITISLLVFVIVKLRLVKSLLFILFTPFRIGYKLLKKFKTRLKSEDIDMTEQEFYQELQQLLERFNKTKI